MQPTMRILENINHNSTKNKDEIFTRLYRYMLRPDIQYAAYKKLYSNDGAATKGINQDTADGFSEDYINKIIWKLRDGTYSPNPVRRTYIEKANGKNGVIDVDYLLDAQTRLTKVLGRRTAIRRKHNKGVIEIEYHGKNDFDALFDALIEFGVDKFGGSDNA